MACTIVAAPSRHSGLEASNDTKTCYTFAEPPWALIRKVKGWMVINVSNPCSAKAHAAPPGAKESGPRGRRGGRANSGVIET